MQKFHGLPIRTSILYKLCTLTDAVYSGKTLAYISKLVDTVASTLLSCSPFLLYI